jgi:hypothetical protein
MSRDSVLPRRVFAYLDPKRSNPSSSGNKNDWVLVLEDETRNYPSELEK